MEISEVVIYLALFLSIALNVLNIDWKNSKTYKCFDDYGCTSKWCWFDVPHFWYITASLKV